MIFQIYFIKENSTRATKDFEKKFPFYNSAQNEHFSKLAINIYNEL